MLLLFSDFLKFSNDFVRAFLIRNPRVWVGGVIDEDDGRERNIQRGERKNDGDSQMMRGVARDLTELEMEAVASYLRGLR